jgi:hypothetical protein
LACVPLAIFSPHSTCYVSDGGQQRGGVATRGGTRCKGHEKSRRVCVLMVALINNWQWSTWCVHALFLFCFREWCVVPW